MYHQKVPVTRRIAGPKFLPGLHTDRCPYFFLLVFCEYPAPSSPCPARYHPIHICLVSACVPVRQADYFHPKPVYAEPLPNNIAAKRQDLDEIISKSVILYALQWHDAWKQRYYSIQCG